MRSNGCLQPELLPVLRAANVTEYHQVFVLVVTLPHAAHKSAGPGSPLDAMNGATSSPVWLLWNVHLVKLEIEGVIFGPVTDLACSKWVRSHSSPAFVANAPTG
jgi:hypothetical protein